MADINETLYRMSFDAISKAILILEEYNRFVLSPDSRPVRMEELKPIISRYTEIDVRYYEVDWIPQYDASTPHSTEGGASGDGHRQIKSKLFRFRDHAKIYYLKKGRITYCDQRFVVAKEMAHLLIDTPDSFTKSPSKLVRALVNEHDFSQGDGDSSVSELVAEVCAMELLFPWQERESFLQKLHDGEMTAWDIADYFKVTEKKITWILGADNHTYLGQIHDDIDK